MYGKKELFAELAQLGIQRDDRVLIHSSYRSLGGFEGGPENLIQSLIEYFSPEGLLIFPTHSWSEIKREQPLFDLATTPSCVGLLPNLFLKQPGVLRSYHPTHSVGAIGPLAAAYIEGEEKMVTPCGAGGCWHKLIDLNAKIVFLGATLKTNTFIHGVEEWADIPGRLTLEQEPLQVKVGERIYDTPQHRHYGSTSEKYDKLYEPFLARKIAHTGKIHQSDVIVCDAPAMAEYVTELLAKNPALFSDFEPVPLEWY